MKYLYTIVFTTLTIGTVTVVAMSSGISFEELCDGMCPAAFNPDDPKLNIQGPGKLEDFKRRMEPWRKFCISKCDWQNEELEKAQQNQVVSVEFTS